MSTLAHTVTASRSKAGRKVKRGSFIRDVFQVSGCKDTAVKMKFASFLQGMFANDACR